MPLKPTPEDTSALNLTPMIDVVFLLVIFFMAATQFADPDKAIELELPSVAEGGASTAAVRQPMVVAISAEGGVTLDGRSVSLTELENDLRITAADRPDLEVLVHGDARCDFQHVAGAMAACRSAGVTDLGVSVEIARAAASVLK